MRHAPTLDLIRHEIRSEICRRCFLRPPRTKWLGNGVPRACEQRCALFTTLPQAHRIGEYLDPMVESYEKALRHLYHDACHCLLPDSICPQGSDLRALRRYENRVIRLLNAKFSQKA